MGGNDMGRIRNRRVKTLVGVLALAAVVSACGPKPAAAPAPASCPAASGDATTSVIFNRVNADRAASGLGALAWNRQLACLASSWSAHMAATGNLYHRDLNATIRSPGYSGYRTLGENVLRGGMGMTGEQMEAAWMASSAHRANILSSAYTSIGIGIWATGDMTKVYATQNFGG
jgi:uncharacterized protein YkwD